MSNETKHLNQKINDFQNQENKARQSNVTTDTQISQHSDFNESNKQIENCQNIQNNLLYKKFFQQKVQQTQITANLHKKAVNWIITFCWTKNYSEQILWSSIAFYYAYYCSIPIYKEKLTLILLSMVNLSLKLYNSNLSLNLNTLKNLSNNAFTHQEFIQVQSKVLNLFQFDLYIPTLLNRIYRLDRVDEQKEKILFLVETLFLSNFQSGINDLMLQDILLLLDQPNCQNQLKKQLIKLRNNQKILQPLHQKFASKFNIDTFMNQILNQN